jgi:hypothetical protein
MQIKNMMIVLALGSSMALFGCTASDVTNLVSNGSSVSTVNKKLAPTNPNKVKLYYSSSENPRHYKVVGRVSAENYSIVAMEHTQAAIAEELKKQAASIGANGVINIQTGLAQTTGDAITTNR